MVYYKQGVVPLFAVVANSTEMFNVPWLQYGFAGITLGLLFWYSRKMFLSSERREEKEQKEKDNMQDHHEEQVALLVTKYEEQIKHMLELHSKEREADSKRYHEMHREIMALLAVKHEKS